MSLQVAILKVLASHCDGRATLASLNRDIAILTASGAEWSGRIRRLASRVPAIDIFGDNYVLRDEAGWQITAAGRDFLAKLEAITQDNLPSQLEQPEPPEMAGAEHGGLVVVGHRFKYRIDRQRPPARQARALSGEAKPRGENART